MSPSLFINAFNNSTLVQAYVEADIQLGIANQVFGAPPAPLHLMTFTLHEITWCLTLTHTSFPHQLETPTFVVNGFKTQFDETTTVGEWVTFIKSLINPSADERRNVM